MQGTGWALGVGWMLEPADPRLGTRPHAAVTKMPVNVRTLCPPSRGVIATATNCGQAVVPNGLPGQGDLSRGRSKGQIGSASWALEFVPVRMSFSLPTEVSRVSMVPRVAGALASWRSGEPSHGPPLLSDEPAPPLKSLPWSPCESLCFRIWPWRTFLAPQGAHSGHCAQVPAAQSSPRCSASSDPHMCHVCPGFSPVRSVPSMQEGSLPHHPVPPRLQANRPADWPSLPPAPPSDPRSAVMEPLLLVVVIWSPGRTPYIPCTAGHVSCGGVSTGWDPRLPLSQVATASWVKRQTTWWAPEPSLCGGKEAEGLPGTAWDCGSWGRRRRGPLATRNAAGYTPSWHRGEVNPRGYGLKRGSLGRWCPGQAGALHQCQEQCL